MSSFTGLQAAVRAGGFSGLDVGSENAFVPLSHKTGPFVQLGGTLLSIVKGNR